MNLNVRTCILGSVWYSQFSKDDVLDLDFITAASNLRALVFSIPLQSKFDIKSIAGNIIPAIATTNAIVAGLEVLQAVKLLQSGDAMAACRYVYCNRSPAGRVKALLMPVQLEVPLARYALLAVALF